MSFMRVGIWAAGFVLLVLGAHEIHVLTHNHNAGAQAVMDHPMPRTMFADAAVASYGSALDQKTAEATDLMQGWWSSHGTEPQDKVFVAWVKAHVPPPPSRASRAGETRQLVGLARSRSSTGTTAAHWLQTYGGRQLWFYEEYKQTTAMTDADRAARHRQLKRVLTLSEGVGTALNKKFHQPAPFVTDPALHPHQKKQAVNGCPCSYPTGDDASTAAASTFLTALYPDRAAFYRHMADEYAYAQVYLGSRLPSDEAAGRLLGDMVGEYFLVTRGHGSPSQVSTILRSAGSSSARSAGAAGSTGGSTAARG